MPKRQKAGIRKADKAKLAALDKLVAQAALRIAANRPDISIGYKPRKDRAALSSGEVRYPARRGLERWNAVRGILPLTSPAAPPGRAARALPVDVSVPPEAKQAYLDELAEALRREQEEKNKLAIDLSDYEGF